MGRHGVCLYELFPIPKSNDYRDSDICTKTAPKLLHPAYRPIAPSMIYCPHRQMTAICWVYNTNGELFEGDPRAVLTRALDYAAALGYTFNTGPELEFFLFKMRDGKISPDTHDVGGYFDLSGDLGADVRKDMVNALEGMGIKVETSHHEVARGQHEIDFEYDNALSTADSAVTLKYTLKAIAAEHGLHCTFMPKPIFGINGSGMHTHQSLAGLESGDNLFSDAEDAYGISPLAK